MSVFFFNTGGKTDLSLSLFDKCFIIETIVGALRERKKKKKAINNLLNSAGCMYDWKTPQGAVRHRSSLDTDTFFLSRIRRRKKTILYRTKHL
jgi:hypothetical protein